jgi:hypothetical protein
VSREELIEQEVQIRAKKRMAQEKGLTPQRIDQILAEEREAERRKVEEGEAWANSLYEAVHLFAARKAAIEYMGFKDGRRTFKL